MAELLAGVHSYDVLNAIALKKMASVDQIAAATGVEPSTVRSLTEELAAAGLVAAIGDQALPMDQAVPALIADAARRYGALREDSEVLEMASRFEAVNAQFLVAISSWQQVDVGGRKMLNDHTNADYDGKVLDRIDKLVQKLQRLIETLSSRDPRFAAYVRRFDEASERVAAGDTDLVSSPVRDSVHNIWFEFHEDLLRTLGRARTE